MGSHPGRRNQGIRLMNSSSQNRHAKSGNDSVGATFEGHPLPRTQHSPATRRDRLGTHVDENAVITQNDGRAVTVKSRHCRLHGPEP